MPPSPGRLRQPSLPRGNGRWPRMESAAPRCTGWSECGSSISTEPHRKHAVPGRRLWQVGREHSGPHVRDRPRDRPTLVEGRIRRPRASRDRGGVPACLGRAVGPVADRAGRVGPRDRRAAVPRGHRRPVRAAADHALSSAPFPHLCLLLARGNDQHPPAQLRRGVSGGARLEPSHHLRVRRSIPSGCAARLWPSDPARPRAPEPRRT